MQTLIPQEQLQNLPKLLKVLLVVVLSLKTGLSLMGIEAKDFISKEEDT